MLTYSCNNGCNEVIFINFALFFVIESMNNGKFVLSMREGVARASEVRFAHPLNVDILKGENVAVVGPNGAGKNLLVDTLLGRYPLRAGSVVYDFSPSESNAVYKNVQSITFRDIYGSSEANYCYQLRWNLHEQEDIPSVREILGCIDDDAAALLQQFHLEDFVDEAVVQLSSGELRKLQIVKALLNKPRLLVLDNPYIGLDVPTRTMLGEALVKLAASNELQMIIILGSREEVPSFVDSVFMVDNRTLLGKFRRDEFCAAGSSVVGSCIDVLRERVLGLPYSGIDFSCDEVLAMNKITVRYGERTILRDFSWRVGRGEVWALSGENGSGKSTLLSLVCADNLQSYACDITLFGRRRGTGESIWEIKKHIGYVSPEMHRSYLRNLPAIEIVASGLHDSIGLYRRSTDAQMQNCMQWMEIFGIAHLRDCSFIRLSSGEQRLVLLARAFVKDPQLLILDEPMHGLDPMNRARARAVIEAFSQRKGKTVIIVSHYEEDFPSTLTDRLVLKKIK